MGLLGKIKNRLLASYRYELEQKLQTVTDLHREQINNVEELMHDQTEEFKRCIEELKRKEDLLYNRLEDTIRYTKDMEALENSTKNVIDQINEKANILFQQIRDEQSFYPKLSFSQSGEDSIVAYILSYLNIPLELVSYLDLGANHAKELSNSYFFYKRGARGVLVEANPELMDELRRERKGDVILNKAIALDTKQAEVEFYSLNGDGLSTISYESALAACKVNPNIFIKETYKIPTISVEEVLNLYFSEQDPILLSIDLEGIEVDILKQIDFEKHRPIIIIIEDIPYSPQLMVDGKENKALDFLQDKGYTEYAFTGINAIYLDKRYVTEYYTKHQG